MLPLAIRINNHQIQATVISTSIALDLGAFLVAGARWYISLQDVSVGDYYYLTGIQPSATLQLLHPDLQRWTTPLLVTYRVVNASTLIPLTLPGVLGTLVLGLPGNPNSSSGTISRIGLDITLRAPGYYDAPKYYAMV